MPYPMFRSTANQRPVISRPLPLRSYQDHENQSSTWSRSEASEHLDDAHPLPNHWPTLIPTLPPKSPLRTRFNRPNPPPALTRNFHAADPDHLFAPASTQTPVTATTTISSTSSASSSASPRSPMTPSPASAPPSHTTFAGADPSFHKWLVATVRHQHQHHHHINSSRRLASAGERDLPPPPTPPKNDQGYDSDYDDEDEDEDGDDATSRDRHAAAAPHARSDSVYDYTSYLQQTSSSIPPPSSLSLCNSSGWSSVARRTARSP